MISSFHPVGSKCLPAENRSGPSSKRPFRFPGKSHHPLLMKIPEPIPGFDAPTYLLFADKLSARLFCGKNRTFELLEKFHSKELPLRDTEKNQKIDTATGVHDAVEDEHLKERARDRFFDFLGEKLFDAWKEEKFKELFVAVPETEKNLFLQKLHPELHASLLCVIPKTLTRVSEAELLDIVHKECEALQD